MPYTKNPQPTYSYNIQKTKFFSQKLFHHLSSSNLACPIFQSNPMLANSVHESGILHQQFLALQMLQYSILLIVCKRKLSNVVATTSASTDSLAVVIAFSISFITIHHRLQKMMPLLLLFAVAYLWSLRREIKSRQLQVAAFFAAFNCYVAGYFHKTSFLAKRN